MAYGSGPQGSDKGSWSQKPPKLEEPKEPPGQPEPPPATTSPAAQPLADVTDASVAAIALESLPKDEDLVEFVGFSREGLAPLANDIVRTSGIDEPAFKTAMLKWLDAVTKAEKELNKKTVIPTAPGPSVPPLPGVESDELCSSTFDANDLALRGRKSVLAKQFYLPLIYPQLLLDPAQKWAFGQKLDYFQEWRHEGFTLGELISSLSLLPNEELTVEISSWQKTKAEIETLTESEEKQLFEREQQRTDEESAVNEAASSNGWSVSATGSVSYGPISASASASASGNTDQRSTEAEKHITQETSRSANQLSLKRAVKMTQTSEAGSEQTTTRRITNPNSCHTVTFNFFQVVKLYDLQFRLENDSITVMLPALFPAFYTRNGQPDLTQPVRIPFWTIESFNSPAVFLTQFFEVNRDLSQELNGWGLRVRTDAGRSPEGSATQLAQALVVATKYLLRLDPAQHVAELASIVRDYVAGAQAMRARSAAAYGPGLGRSQQITTPGIYADSLLGRCTACEDYVESSRFMDIMRQQEEVRQLERANKLADLESERREKLLQAGKLEPFETLAPPEA